MRKFLLALLLCGTALYAGTIKVTFQVNMKIQMKKGFFAVGDSVVARGDFQEDAVPGSGSWSGNLFKLTDANADSIYTLDINLPDAKVGTTYNFKFVKNDSGWEPDPNRTFTLENVVNQVLPVVYFANDSIFKPTVVNTIQFTANMSDIYGTGVGFFDPNQDSIIVAGLDWDGLGTVVSGNRKLEEQTFPAKRFKTEMTIRGVQGDSTKWKFRAYPENRFTNTGWELGSDRWFKYVADGSVVTLDEIKPNISPAFPPLTADVTARFICNMGTAPKNQYDSSLIPIDSIKFVAVKGGSIPIGNWGGSWIVTDTAAPNATMFVLNKLARDKFQRDIVFPAGTVSGKIEFKYGCFYPGAETKNGGASYLDNEGGFGLNHWIMIIDSPTMITTTQTWGVMVGIVRDTKNADKATGFELGQNYPNPFNPTTNFSYTIPVNGNVSLKVYNAMGEEVADIFRGFQTAGTYKATVDGFGLSSGVYFYTLRVGDYSATRKMVLMK